VRVAERESMNFLSPLEKLTGYLVGALVVGGLAWWFGDSFITWVRAPVVAELEKAQGANDSLVAAKTKAEAETARLNVLLATRTNREAASDRKLEGLKNALDQLAARKPEVQAWTVTRIPDDVIGLRTIHENSGQGNSGPLRDPNQPDSAHRNAATPGSWGDKRATVAAETNAGSAAGSVQQPPTGRASVATKTLTERFNATWGK